jgi:hypothetical protein
MRPQAAHKLVEEKGKEWAEKRPDLDVVLIVNLITDGVMIGLEMANDATK